MYGFDTSTELYPLIGTSQDPKWHPEGDAWEHTRQTVDWTVQQVAREDMDRTARVVLVLAALLHDVGKPSCTTLDDDGRIRAKGHQKLGLPVAESFLNRIGAPQAIQDRVLPLIAEHMVLTTHRGEGVTERMVRRLAVRLEPATIQELIWVIECDHMARGIASGTPYELDELGRLAEQLDIENSKPEPILMGRHLLEEGIMESGPKMGKVLDAVFEHQLDGEVWSLDGALELARMLLELAHIPKE